MKRKNKKGGNSIIVILLLVVTVTVYFFPKIREYIIEKNSPKIEQAKQEKEEKKEFNEEVYEDMEEKIKFPIMRTNIYSSDSNYLMDKFTIDNLSNSDILLNAFLDMYEGNITSTGTPARCGGTGATFDSTYLGLRVKNILRRDLNYKLETFEVPEGSNTKYPGTWTYDASGKRFVYDGLCNKNSGSTKYYDLKQLKEGKFEGDDDLILYYYVGFAKVEGNKYTIYSKPDMKNEIGHGDFVDLESLQNVYESINSNNKSVYKYVFKSSLCTYSDYCLYEGSWN